MARRPWQMRLDDRRWLRRLLVALAPRSPGLGSEERFLAGRFSRRATLLAAGQAGLAAFLGLKLYELQVTYSPRYRLLAEANRINVQALAALRGTIRDRFGVLLAESVENLQAVAIPDLAGDMKALVARLERVIELSAQDRRRLLATIARQARLTPVIVKEDLSWGEFARINVLAPQLPGVEAQRSWSRRYQQATDICHVVGYVGKADLVEVDRDPVLRLPGQRVGKAGVELGMERQLRGRPGLVRREVDARGRVVRELERLPAESGSNLTLTIDAALQRSVQQRLAREDFGSVVAIDVASGDILAMASTPTYDANDFLDGISLATWQRLEETDGEPLINKAIRGQYPPGSTFKIVTALAALSSGAVRPDTVVTCSGGLDYGGQHFGCWKAGGHGAMRLHDALRESCDVYFYEAARLMGIEALAKAGSALGFGIAHDIGMAGVRAGVMPDPEWKLKVHSRPWLGGETLLAGIGQGYASASPLQLALMVARLASGNALLPSIVSRGGSAPAAVPLAFAAEHLQAVRAGLVAAVNEPGGTGATAFLPGVVVAGKTGTAQVASLAHAPGGDQSERRLRDHSLFVGYAPAEQPRYAAAAVIEHGGGGAKAAAPLVRDVIAELLLRDPVGRPAADPPQPRRNSSLPAARRET